MLHEQLGQKRLRFNDDQRPAIGRQGQGIGKLLREVATIVTPEMLLAWHRRLIAQKYDESGKRGRGRLRKSEEIEDPVVLLAEENRSWGYRRIQGALSNLGRDQCFLPPFHRKPYVYPTFVGTLYLGGALVGA